MAKEHGINYRGTSAPYMFLRQKSTGYIWNGTTFVAVNLANIATYDLPASSQGLNWWTVDMPFGLDNGRYIREWREYPSGTTTPTPPDITLKAGEEFYWNGLEASVPGPEPGPYGDLQDVRLRFRQMSGRFDLVDATGSDAKTGGDRFINDAQRWLDLNQKCWKSEARQIENLTVGQSRITLLDCRSILEVWISNSEERTILTKKSLAWIRWYYGDFTELENGTPLYFARTIMRLTPRDSYSGGFDGMFDYVDTMLHRDGEPIKAGLLLMPPADGVYTVNVIGTFFSPRLQVAADISHWTYYHPDILAKAALFKLEEFYQNLTRSRAMEESLRSELFGIEKDQIEEESVGITQMGR